MITTTSCILKLNDISATLETTGGKGASLARLASAGLPVPGGFHITTAAYAAFVEANHLQDAILEAVRGADAASPDSLEVASRTIRALFEQAPVPQEIAAQIAQAYAELPGQPAVAVRSSATAEDLPDLSFAGQQETFLNVRGAQAVTTAARRCWASLWTARAIGYRIQHNIDQAAVRLAVVVQELVPAEAAGIMFTANPLNGRREQAAINAAWGLGEAIVGGLVTPDTILVEKASGRVLSRETADKQLMTVRTETGTEEQPVAAELRRAPVLDDAQAAALAELGARIETLYGMPMDIEWALAGGQIYILQARPITALPEPEADVPTGWPMPDPKGKYARGSIIDLLPDPLTPLFRSMGVRVINDQTMGLYKRLMNIEPHEFHPFWTVNDYLFMSVKFPARILARMLIGGLSKTNMMLTTGERNWREDSHPRYLAAIRRWSEKPAAAMTAAELLRGAEELLTETAYTYTVLQSGIIPAATMSEMKFTQIYNRLIKKPQDPPAPVFLFGFESAPIRAEMALYDLAATARGCPALAEYLAATPGEALARQIESGLAPAGVPETDWLDWRAGFQRYLGQHGASIYDLDFAKPTPVDAPAALLDTLRMYLRGEVRSPYERVRALAEQREQATQAVLRRIGGLRRKWFLSALESARKDGPLREDGLADMGLGYPLLRRLLLELGGRLARAGRVEKAEDVFWLTEDELRADVAALDKASAALDKASAALDKGVLRLESLAAEIAERKAVWRAEKRLTPPTLLPAGSKMFGMDLEKMGAMTSQEGETIQGVPGSPGRVTAVARVLEGPEDFAQMQPGEVLVAAITTPAWTPLFARAAAVVTDVGGPLSHSSIVAREYGIPAVLGTGVATRRIQTGMRITVDGTAGTVALEQEA